MGSTNSNVAGEHLLPVIVLGLNHFVPRLEAPSVFFDGFLGVPGRVQCPLQAKIQLSNAQRSPVHWTQNLDVPDRIKAKADRYPMLDEVDQGGHDLLGIITLHKMKGGGLSRRSEFW